MGTVTKDAHRGLESLGGGILGQAFMVEVKKKEKQPFLRKYVGSAVSRCYGLSGWCYYAAASAPGSGSSTSECSTG